MTKSKYSLSYIIGLSLNLLPIVLLPMLINSVSSRDYAVIAFFATFTTLMSMFDCGLSHALLRRKVRNNAKISSVLFVVLIILLFFVTLCSLYFYRYGIKPLTYIELFVILLVSSLKLLTNVMKINYILSGKLVEINIFSLLTTLIRYSPLLFNGYRENLEAYLFSFLAASVIEIVLVASFGPIRLRHYRQLSIKFVLKLIVQARYISILAGISLITQFVDRFASVNMLEMQYAATYLATASVASAVLLVLNPATNIIIHLLFRDTIPSRDANELIYVIPLLLFTNLGVAFVNIMPASLYIIIPSISDTVFIEVFSMLVLGNVLLYILGIEYFQCLKSDELLSFGIVSLLGLCISWSLFTYFVVDVKTLAYVWPLVSFTKLVLLYALARKYVALLSVAVASCGIVLLSG